MFNQLVFNPSYAGIHNNTIISLNSRFQWTNFEGSPTTNTISGATSIIGGKVGIGAAIILDQLGTSKNTQGQISYAYKIQQGSNTFSFGLQTGFTTLKVNDESLNLKVQDDPFFANGEASITKVNFGAGATYLTDHYMVSISVPRLINSKFESNNVSVEYKRHFYITGAYLFELSRTFKLKPSILLKGVQGAPLSADINVSGLIMNQIWAGVFTRNFNTFGIMSQFEFMDAYKIGYSFELIGKNLTGSGLPTHEIMLSADLAIFSHQSVFQRYF